MTEALCVQVKGGGAGLCDGAQVVLGPDSGLMEPGPGQQFINQKMRPGSGVLSVQVLPDGPTRVLQVRQSRGHARSCAEHLMLQERSKAATVCPFWSSTHHDAFNEIQMKREDYRNNKVT